MYVPPTTPPQPQGLFILSEKENQSAPLAWEASHTGLCSAAESAPPCLASLPHRRCPPPPCPLACPPACHASLSLWPSPLFSLQGLPDFVRNLWELPGAPGFI